MRMFRADGRLFTGFDKDFTTPHRLVLCQDEDTIDVWAVDGENITDEMDNLLRYFTHSQSQQRVIGTYSEEGFRGFVAADRFVSPLSRFNK